MAWTYWGPPRERCSEGAADEMRIGRSSLIFGNCENHEQLAFLCLVLVKSSRSKMFPHECIVFWSIRETHQTLQTLGRERLINGCLYIPVIVSWKCFQWCFCYFYLFSTGLVNRPIRGDAWVATASSITESSCLTEFEISRVRNELSVRIAT